MTSNHTNDSQTPTAEEPLSSAHTPSEAYAAALAGFDGYYRRLLIRIGSVMLLAVALALLTPVVIGVAVAALGAVAYAYYTKNALSSRLGLTYRSIVGGLAITSIKPCCEQTVYVPATLMYTRVITLKACALAKEGHTVELLYLPATLRTVEDGAWDGAISLRTVCFGGTAEQWEALGAPALPEGVSLSFEEDYPRSRA